MSLRSVARRTSQTLACLVALGSGAAAAHLTHAEAQPGLPPLNRALPAQRAAVAPPLTRTLAETAEPEAATEVDAAPAAASADLPFGVVPPRADPFGERLRHGMVMHGGTRHRMILFTFDDGPELRSTPRLLDMLDETGVKAVFFVNATHFDADTERQRAQGELLNDIIARGHFIGNHTHHHAALTDLTHDEIREELSKNEDYIFRFTGGRPVLVRPPYGAFSPRVARSLAELGYTPMLWNLATGDTMVRTADEVVSLFHRILRRREREAGEYGGIVLMHDTHGWSVEAFPRIVASLRQQNCQLLEEGKELYDFVDDPSVFFSYRGEQAPEALTPMAEPDPAWLEQRQALLRDETERRCSAVATRD